MLLGVLNLAPLTTFGAAAQQTCRASVACTWHVRGMHVRGMYVRGMYVACMWHVCGMYVAVALCNIQIVSGCMVMYYKKSLPRKQGSDFL